VVDHEPTKDELTSHPRVARIVFAPASYNAVRTSMDLPIAQEVGAAVRSARGDVVLLPTMGGSVPLEAIVRAARTHTLPCQSQITTITSTPPMRICGLRISGTV
jgi:hypothetical protein